MALIIALVNKSNLAEVSDYTYEVMVGDGSVARSKTIERGKVTGHTRSDGWEVLVKKMLEQRTGEPTFCKACGASIPPRFGEGQCERCM